MDWFLVSVARTMTDRPDLVASALTWGLCADCRSDSSDRHHRPGYKMVRTPYDIPGHAFVSMTSMIAAVDAAGGTAAVLAAVLS